MPPKRPTNSASSSRVKRAKQPARPARKIRAFRGVDVTNIRTNTSRRLDGVKILKVPNPRGGRRGFTIVATVHARPGDSAVIEGVRYVIRSEQQLRRLVNEGRYTDVARTCTSRITNMSGMFKDAPGFNQPIGHWDTSRVTEMRGMFLGATQFNQPICGWNTSRVTNMYEMFSNAFVFNQHIGGWDTSRVEHMGHMFEGAYAFNQDIGGWDTSRVERMEDMFYFAINFNRPIGRWNTSNVTNMTMMFAFARGFNQDISGWNVRSVRGMRYMFSGARQFNRNLTMWATKLPRDVDMDDDTTRRIYGDPLTHAFRSRQYRLHPSANAIDPVMMNRVPLNDARVIAGDVVGKNTRIRHVFHKNTLNAIARHGGGVLRHPSTRAVFKKAHIVPLRDVLHANDAAIYNRVGVNERTVEDVRKNANKAKIKKNAR